ncbi:MAG: type II secretion system protein GspM [Succinivibrionaceae bacterium]
MNLNQFLNNDRFARIKDKLLNLSPNEKYLLMILFIGIVCFTGYLAIITPISKSLNKAKYTYNQERAKYHYIIDNAQDIPNREVIREMGDCTVYDCVNKTAKRVGITGLNVQRLGGERVNIVSKESYKYSQFIKLIFLLERNNNVVVEQLIVDRKQDGMINISKLVLLKKL